MLTLSKLISTSVTLALIATTTACGGGGGSSTPLKEPGSVTPTPSTIQYPASSIFSLVTSSMYTLTSPAACGESDPYCRIVAGKDAFLDIQLDPSITALRLQITPDYTPAIIPPTVASDCDAACWKEARLQPSASLHLTGTQLEKKDKNVFRIRIPAHLNSPSSYWSVNFDGPIETKDGLVSKTYSPKTIVRSYFAGDPIDLVIVPLRINSAIPKNFPNIFQIASIVGITIPMPLSSIRIGDTIDISNVTTMETMEDFTTTLKTFTQKVNATTGRTYWYGMFSDTVRKGNIAGIGYQPGYSAIGWDNPAQWNRAITHELGHNFGLPHTACGNTGTVDPDYPYPNGDLYASNAIRYPFDLSQGLERVEEKKDVMGYCGGHFFSNYSISKIWKFIQPSPSTTQYDTALSNASFPVPVTIIAKKPYSLEELYTHWNMNPPQLKKNLTTIGNVFTWISGLSNLPDLKKLTIISEKALPGIPVEVQHADGIWYPGVAYRTSEGSTLDIWTPAIGFPLAIRVPGI